MADQTGAVDLEALKRRHTEHIGGEPRKDSDRVSTSVGEFRGLLDALAAARYELLVATEEKALHLSEFALQEAALAAAREEKGRARRLVASLCTAGELAIEEGDLGDLRRAVGAARAALAREDGGDG